MLQVEMVLEYAVQGSRSNTLEAKWLGSQADEASQALQGLLRATDMFLFLLQLHTVTEEQQNQRSECAGRYKVKMSRRTTSLLT